jgi:hypothetical protein
MFFSATEKFKKKKKTPRKRKRKPDLRLQYQRERSSHEGVANPPTKRSMVGREERRFWGKYFLSNVLKNRGNYLLPP